MTVKIDGFKWGATFEEQKESLIKTAHNIRQNLKSTNPELQLSVTILFDYFVIVVSCNDSDFKGSLTDFNNKIKSAIAEKNEAKSETPKQGITPEPSETYIINIEDYNDDYVIFEDQNTNTKYIYNGLIYNDIIADLEFKNDNYVCKEYVAGYRYGEEIIDTCKIRISERYLKEEISDLEMKSYIEDFLYDNIEKWEVFEP